MASRIKTITEYKRECFFKHSLYSHVGVKAIGMLKSYFRHKILEKLLPNGLYYFNTKNAKTSEYGIKKDDILKGIWFLSSNRFEYLTDSLQLNEEIYNKGDDVYAISREGVDSYSKNKYYNDFMSSVFEWVKIIVVVAVPVVSVTISLESVKIANSALDYRINKDERIGKEGQLYKEQKLQKQLIELGSELKSIRRQLDSLNNSLGN